MGFAALRASSTSYYLGEYVNGGLFLRLARNQNEKFTDPGWTTPIEVDHFDLSKPETTLLLRGGVKLVKIQYMETEANTKNPALDLTLRDFNGKTWTSSILTNRYTNAQKNRVGFTRTGNQILLTEDRNGMPFGCGPLERGDKIQWASRIHIGHWGAGGGSDLARMTSLWRSTA